MPTYTLRPGYGFVAVFEDAGTDYRTIPNDSWEISVLPHNIAEIAPRYLGTREIDGAPCAVFKDEDGAFYAQTTIYAQRS